MTTITKECFDELVSDFEYGIIDTYNIGEYTISWQELDETCWLLLNNEVIETGSFEHILEQFLMDEENV